LASTSCTRTPVNPASSTIVGIGGWRTGRSRAQRPAQARATAVELHGQPFSRQFRPGRQLSGAEQIQFVRPQRETAFAALRGERGGESLTDASLA